MSPKKFRFMGLAGWRAWLALAALLLLIACIIGAFALNFKTLL